MAKAPSAQICAVCGTATAEEECPCCHGSGDDPDQDVIEGRYVTHACWVCDGSGVVQHCANDYDAAHQAAYELKLQQPEGGE